jgi:hypothetical protein
MSQRRPQAKAVHGGARVGDVERNACVEQLTRELVAGRLTEEEFDQRVEQALQARTRAELSDLTADVDSGPSGARGSSVARRPSAPVVSLSGRDVAVGSAFAAVIGVVTFFIGMQMDYGDRALTWLLLWLFGVGSGAVGALLARGRRHPG